MSRVHTVAMSRAVFCIISNLSASDRVDDHMEFCLFQYGAYYGFAGV